VVANFFFSSVNHVLIELRMLISTSHTNMKIAAVVDADELANDPRHNDAADQAQKALAFCVDGSERLFSDLKCPHIQDAAQRLKNTPQNPLSWSELNTRSRALRNSIEVELREYLFYQYPKQRGEKLRAWSDDWKAALAAFPDIRCDVFCAIDCYALQHNTASVFHSMRVAEHGLRALAKERRVRLAKDKPIEWGTWQEIIKALDEEIKVIGLKRKAGAAKDNALEFYSGARADLNGFKDEYRNLVMHVRDTYDEHQALRALTIVHAFMARLAEKIDSRHHRIKWGLRR
jgi:hypothetical protein